MSKYESAFSDIKNSLLKLDPVNWAETNLMLDGKPYRIVDSGYRPIAEILRYMCIIALRKDAKPMVWNKARQVSGTITSSVAVMYLLGSGLFGQNDNPPMRIAYTWPSLGHAAAYSKTKLSALIDSSVLINDQSGKRGKRPLMRTLIDPSSPTNDSLQFKQFINGNHIWIESLGIDGGRMRGKTCDYLLSDEFQDVPDVAIANTTKILTKANYGPTGDGVQVYFGTPKQKGSSFWDMWNQSSQQYFHLGCSDCQKDFPLYTPGSDKWEKIWLYGNIVKCTHCGCEQDRMEAINRGKWVAYRDPNDAKFVGFHLNQLYLPDFTKEKIIAAKPENSVVNTERAYQNEVLGEFFHGEAGIISPEEIRERCGDPERKYRANIVETDQVMTFLGIDIGARADFEQLADSDRVHVQGQSYSVAVVLALHPGNRLSIEFATKFKKNDLASKKAIIDEMMKKYRCKLAVCDIGYANDLNELMQTEYGERFLSSESSGKVNDHIKFNSERFPKMITFERDFWIREMYEQLKKGNIRFPMGSYEQVSWLMQHCSNMEIKTSISRFGSVSPHYVKSGPNDGFMALINAFLAYKFHVSKGFNIKNPLLQQTEIGNKPQSTVMLGYMPYKK